MVEQHYHQQRGYTEADWTGAQADPVLAEREIGYVTDTGEYVIGDGVTAFSSLSRYGLGAGQTVETESGTTFTPTIADANTYQRLTNSSAVTVTVPPNSSVAYDIGTEIALYAAGAGGATIEAGAGVTINDNVALAQYQLGVLVKVATDEWDFHGPGGITLVEYADTVNALGNSTGTVALNPANGMWVTMTLTGNITIDLSNMSTGQTLVLDIAQDGTGSYTVSFTQAVEWSGGTAFTHTGTANSRDRVTVDYNGTTYTGAVIGKDYS